MLKKNGVRMKNEPEIINDDSSSCGKMSLYRRKTDREDLIVLSVGSREDGEDLATSVKLDDVQIDIVLISGRRRRERVITGATPALDDPDRD